MFLRARPPLAAGQGFIALKRHCEHLGELSPEEVAALGPVIQRTARALDQALHPVRVHFGLYAEGVHHLHLHVLPRMPDLPAGNIPITLLSLWYDLLARLRLRQPCSDQAVAAVASWLSEAFQRLPDQPGWDQAAH